MTNSPPRILLKTDLGAFELFSMSMVHIGCYWGLTKAGTIEFP